MKILLVILHRCIPGNVLEVKLPGTYIIFSDVFTGKLTNLHVFLHYVFYLHKFKHLYT